MFSLINPHPFVYLPNSMVGICPGILDSRMCVVQQLWYFLLVGSRPLTIYKAWGYSYIITISIYWWYYRTLFTTQPIALLSWGDVFVTTLHWRPTRLSDSTLESALWFWSRFSSGTPVWNVLGINWLSGSIRFHFMLSKAASWRIQQP